MFVPSHELNEDCVRCAIVAEIADLVYLRIQLFISGYRTLNKLIEYLSALGLFGATFASTSFRASKLKGFLLRVVLDKFFENTNNRIKNSKDFFLDIEALLLYEMICR